jgi:hypothetical protein
MLVLFAFCLLPYAVLYLEPGGLATSWVRHRVQSLDNRPAGLQGGPGGPGWPFNRTKGS